LILGSRKLAESEFLELEFGERDLIPKFPNPTQIAVALVAVSGFDVHLSEGNKFSSNSLEAWTMMKFSRFPLRG